MDTDRPRTERERLWCERHRHLAWSNPLAAADTVLARALLAGDFPALSEAVSVLGPERVARVWGAVRDTPEARAVARDVGPMLAGLGVPVAGDASQRPDGS